MLRYVAPLGLSQYVRGIVNSAPPQVQVLVFCFLIAACVQLWAKIIAWLYCRVDYAVATLFRRGGFAPPALQFWVGDLVEKLPRWTFRLGLCLFVLSVGWTLVGLNASFSRTSVVGRAYGFFSVLVNFLWG